jgi:hypothetical protein
MLEDGEKAFLVEKTLRRFVSTTTSLEARTRADQLLSNFREPVLNAAPGGWARSYIPAAASWAGSELKQSVAVSFDDPDPRILANIATRPSSLASPMPTPPELLIALTS